MPAQRSKPTLAERLACAHSTRGHAGGSRDRANAPDHRPCGKPPPPGPPRPSPLATGLSAAAVLRAQGRTFSSRLGLLLKAGPIRPMLPFIRTTASLPSLAAHPRFRNLAPCAPRVRAKPLRARPLRQVLGGLRVPRLPRRGLGPWALRLGPCVLGRPLICALGLWPCALSLGPWALGLGPNKKPPVFTGGQIMCVSTGSGLVRPSEQPEHNSTHKGESH